jgi:hypothetical protein
MEELDIFNCVEETPKEIRDQVMTVIANGMTPEAIVVLRARSYYIKPEILAVYTGDVSVAKENLPSAEKTPEITKDQIIEKLIAGGLVEGEHFKKSDKKEKLLEILAMLETPTEEETVVETVEATEEIK